MDASYTFPRDVLEAIPLIGSGARDGGARLGTRSEAGLPLCPVAITALLEVRSAFKLPGKKLALSPFIPPVESALAGFGSELFLGNACYLFSN